MIVQKYCNNAGPEPIGPCVTRINTYNGGHANGPAITSPIYHQDRIHDSLEKDTPARRPITPKPLVALDDRQKLALTYTNVTVPSARYLRLLFHLSGDRGSQVGQLPQRVEPERRSRLRNRPVISTPG